MEFAQEIAVRLGIQLRTCRILLGQGENRAAGHSTVVMAGERRRLPHSLCSFAMTGKGKISRCARNDKGKCRMMKDE